MKLTKTEFYWTDKKNHIPVNRVKTDLLQNVHDEHECYHNLRRGTPSEFYSARSYEDFHQMVDENN